LHARAEDVAPALASPPVASPAPRPRTPEEALVLFRAGLDTPTVLIGGSSSREALVRRFARAIAASDTVAIRTMILNRAEFAWLYFPSSPYTRPPTVQEAPLAWFLLLQNSQKGITRVFDRFGGQEMEYVGHRCAPEPSREGANLLWDDCVVELKPSAQAVVSRRLFGSIIERDGRFKFLSYTNDY
jgi:hypothetical protein